MLVPPEAFKVSKACDTEKESTRYALGAVKLERKDGRGRAVATNGRMLAMVEWSEPDTSEYPHPAAREDCDRLIARAQWDELAKVHAKNARKQFKEILRHAVIGNHENPNLVTTVTIDTDLNQSVKDCRVMEGRFPKYEDCIPKYGPSDCVEVRMDADMLVELLEMANKDDDGNRHVNIMVPLSNADTKPVLIRQRVGGVELTLVQMPCAGGVSYAKPAATEEPEPESESDDSSEDELGPQAEIDTEVATEEEEREVVSPEVVEEMSGEAADVSECELKSLILAMTNGELEQLAIDSGCTPEDLLAFASE